VPTVPSCAEAAPLLIFRLDPQPWEGMFNWLRRRRLSPDARKRLLILAARSEEAIIETHVGNLLDLLDELGDEVDLDRALTIYAEMMSLDESHASSVTNRLLARLESPDRGRHSPGRFRNVFRDGGR
jgi:hypothetical protein